jgi:hypothetical protein
MSREPTVRPHSGKVALAGTIRTTVIGSPNRPTLASVAKFSKNAQFPAEPSHWPASR